MQSLTGTWRITVPQSEGNPETFTALHTFFADGNWSETNSLREINHGVWAAAGGSHQLTFEGYTFDGEGRCSGSLQVRAAVDLLDDDHIAAHWATDIIDLQGRVTNRAFYGTYTGTRMAVEHAGVAAATTAP
jgi:hypothetical protein